MVKHICNQIESIKEMLLIEFENIKQNGSRIDLQLFIVSVIGDYGPMSQLLDVLKYKSKFIIGRTLPGLFGFLYETLKDWIKKNFKVKGINII